MARRRAAGNVQARLQAAADGLRPRLSFGDWCRETGPRLHWDWAHLRLIRAVLARMDPRAETLDSTPEPLADFRSLVLPRQFRRLRLSVPPQHGKSEQVTMRWPAWLLEHDPALRVVVGAYSASLAEKFSRRTRRILAGRTPLSRDRNTAADWETTADGGLRAVGVGGGITGNPAEVILIDDPVKSRAEAESRPYRNRCWEWYTDDLYTRLGQTGLIVLIMTRWHHDDLAGRIERSPAGEDWVTLNLPALADPGEPDPLGRAPGEALCPARFTAAALADKKQTLQSRFVALYQGRPTPAEGGLIKLAWFPRYALAPMAPKRIVQSWDCAQSADPTADFSVCTTWAETARGDYFLLDVWRERVTYPNLKRAAYRLAQREPRPDTLLVESASHGSALIQELQSDRAFRTPVIAIHPREAKAIRLAVEADQMEAHRVWLPEDAPWLPDYLDELIKFPAVAHDDQCDSTSQFLRWARGVDERRAGYEWAVIK